MLEDGGDLVVSATELREVARSELRRDVPGRQHPARSDERAHAVHGKAAAGVMERNSRREFLRQLEERQILAIVANHDGIDESRSEQNRQDQCGRDCGWRAH
jgi:hypothetical protein